MKLNKTRETLINDFMNVLEEGQLPFTGKWNSISTCFNPVSDTRYKGINRVVLSITAMKKGYADPRWVTFNQASKMGWKVKKGAKGTPIEFWSYYNIKTKKIISIPEMISLIAENTDNKEIIKPISHVYSVFNGEVIEGIGEYQLPLNNIDVNDSLAYKVLNRYVKNEGIDLVHELGENAYYSPSTDSIHLPLKEQFTSEYNYLSVLSHEICHSTGAEKRLNRGFGEPFSERYAMEELRAEIGAAFVAGDLGLNIDENSLNNHKSYIQSWLDAIKEKPTELFKAINEAQDICDYVMEKGERELFKDINLLKKDTIKTYGISNMIKNAKEIKREEKKDNKILNEQKEICK